MGWWTRALLLVGLALGSCNTFDDPPSDDPDGPLVQGPSFGGPSAFPTNPPIGLAGFGGSPAGSGGVAVAGAGGHPFPGGWQPIDAGLPPTAGRAADADAGSDDAGL